MGKVQRTSPGDQRLTLKQAAERCGCDVKTLRRDRDNGRLDLESDSNGTLLVSLAQLVAIGRCEAEAEEQVGERLTRQRAEARLLEVQAENTLLQLEISHRIRLEGDLRAHIETLQHAVRIAAGTSNRLAAA